MKKKNKSEKEKTITLSMSAFLVITCIGVKKMGAKNFNCFVTKKKICLLFIFVIILITYQKSHNFYCEILQISEIIAKLNLSLKKVFLIMSHVCLIPLITGIE